MYAIHVCVCLCTVFPNESVKHSGIWINGCWNYLFWFLITNYYNYLVFLCYTSSWIFPKGTEVFGSLNWQLWKLSVKIQSSPVMSKGHYAHSFGVWDEHWWMWENEYPVLTTTPDRVLQVVFVAFTFLQLCMMGVLQMCPV